MQKHVFSVTLRIYVYLSHGINRGDCKSSKLYLESGPSAINEVGIERVRCHFLPSVENLLLR